jgi:hypothetical protein
MWCPRQRRLDAGLEVMMMQDVHGLDDARWLTCPPAAYMPHGAYQSQPFKHDGGGREGHQVISQRRGAPARQGCSQDGKANGFLLGISSPTTSNTTLTRAFKRKHLNEAPPENHLV